MVNLCQLCCSDFPVGKRPFKAGLQGKPEDHWRSRNQKPHKLDPKKTSNLPGFTGESFQELQWLHPGPKVAAVAVTNDHWHHRPHTADQGHQVMSSTFSFENGIPKNPVVDHNFPY